MRWRAGFCVVASVFLYAAVVLGQGTTGSLDGRIFAESGAVLPGVTVSITSPSLMGSRTAVTTDSGIYRFPAIPPGVYAISFDLDGFEKVVWQDIRVQLSTATTVEVKLKVSSLKETVTVLGESPVVDVRSTNVGSVLTAQLLDNLPSSRQLTGVLAETPGIQSANIEVGVSNLAGYSAPRTYGVAGRQQFNLEGVDITQGGAHVGTYPDYTSWEEIEISTGAHKAEARYPGMLTNTVIKSGGNSFRGQAYGDLQNDKFESDNSSPELAARGLKRGTRLDKYWEASGEFGGPIKRDRVWFYSGLRRQHYGSFPAGYFNLGSDQPASTFVQMDGLTLKGTVQLSANDRITSFVQRTVKWVPNSSAGSGIPPGSTINWYVYGMPWKAEWSHILSNRSYFDVGAYVHMQDWHTNPNSNAVRRYDLTTLWTDGSFSNPNSANDNGNYQRLGARPQLRTTFYTQRERHEVKVGFEYVPYVEQVTQRGSIGQSTLLFQGGTTPTGIAAVTPEQLAGRFGAPSQVIIENTPVTVKDGLLTISGYAQDTWTIGDRMTLNVGGRLDKMEAYFPEQNSAQRFWAPAESFPETRNVVTWTSFAPRIGVVYSLTADKRTAVKLNFGQYFEMIEPRIYDLVNLNGWKKAWYTWTDVNRDGLLIAPDGSAEPGEIDLPNPFRTSGGSTTTISKDLRQPRMDEIAVAFDRQLLTDFAVGFDYNYRRLTNNLALVNQFQTPDQFNIPVTVVDPGRDGKYGTSDDATVNAFNLNPALIGGQFVRNVLTNPDGFDQTYHSFTVSVDRHLRANWQLRASMTASAINEVIKGGGVGFDNRFTFNNWPTNPNETMNSRTDWLNWNGRVLGTYRWPKLNLMVSGVFRMQSGEQFGRRFLTRAREVNYGTQWFWAEPLNSQRNDNAYIADVRAEKAFAVGSRRAAVMIDGYNIFNTAAILAQNNTSGASYQTVTSVVNPRVFKIALRINF